ncbi:MAG TPA: sugar ABC transporter substrate-binding protein [Acidimicrobiaceae bacterium]|nr:sugar ABC transporter substrate-binding protein [Acidimicrobiaceae bacterium]HCB37908.1 sugar ABC transporter substrate-binding protein [Acidimicrobiaceae bacterium]
MRKTMKLLAMLAALTLLAAACSSDDDDSSSSADTTGGLEAGQVQVDLAGHGECTNTYHVITHGDSGSFWSVVEVGVRDAAFATGCEVVYFGANNNAESQSQAIEAAIAAGAAGIAISLADPAGLTGAAQAVTDAGIPLYTLNSGVNQYKELGAVTHIGQTEIVAGNGAGERFNDLGATHVLCARQEQSNIGLEERCQGLEETFNGTVTSEFVGLDANPDEQANTIAALLTATTSIDAVLGVGPNVAIRALDAAGDAGREIIIGGFDLSGDLIDAIEDGDVAFTVDQQQYLQGYLPVILMHLQATNQNTAGGGLPVLTGPGFVTPQNAATVKTLVTAGTR